MKAPESLRKARERVAQRRTELAASVSTSPAQTLADLAQNPALIAELSIDAIAGLLALCAALQSGLAARLAEDVLAVDSKPPASRGVGRLDDRLLTVPEVAEQVQLKPAYLYELARTGKIPSVRVGRYVRIDPAQLRAWLDQRENPLAA